MRKIIHIDMDAFFASIEQRDNPALRGVPVAVGRAGGRSVVAAASYEARSYGVRSAMPSSSALARCPHLIFTPVRFDVYRRVSDQIMGIFREYTDKVEPLSLDEAYLDVTVNRKGCPSATVIAREIKRRILHDTGLTASAGVSFNKFLAKVASDYDKPDGLTVVTDGEADAFIGALRIEQFWGVGKVTAGKMHSLGIFTGDDLRRFSEAELVRHFGRKSGHLYYQFARGVDDREVMPDRERKSVGSETTFGSDVADAGRLRQAVEDVAAEVWRRVQRRGFHGRTVTLKIKYADFCQITRSRTLPGFVDDFETLRDAGLELFAMIGAGDRAVRLVGLSVGHSAVSGPSQSTQLSLPFQDPE